jgi:hypothetical protein
VHNCLIVLSTLTNSIGKQPQAKCQRRHSLLKASPYINDDMKIHGYVFDLLDSGLLIKV